MRNPLLDSMIGWDATRKGHIAFWKLTESGQILSGHTGDLEFLIDTANKHSSIAGRKKSANDSFDYAFGNSLSNWMSRFLKNGFDKKMLRDLRDQLDGVRFFHVINPAIPSRGKPLPHWEFVADMEDFDDPDTTAAYAFAAQLTIDGFAALKRCELKDCQKFFTGRPNSKWCSGKCGSKHRVRLMRRREKF